MHCITCCFEFHSLAFDFDYAELFALKQVAIRVEYYIDYLVASFVDYFPIPIKVNEFDSSSFQHFPFFLLSCSACSYQF